MGFADFDIMGKCKAIIEKVEEIATNLSEVKTSASGAKASADNAKASADTAASNTSVIGATGNTGGSATAGTVMAKLNALLTSWTSTRAGYIDNIRSYTVTNNTASKTGVLSAKLAYVINLLENATYGLSAIKSNGGAVKSVQRGTVNAATKNTGVDSSVKMAPATGGPMAYTAYFDLTISAVNTSKAFVILDNYIESNANALDNRYVPVLLNSTTIRIYLSGLNSSTADFYMEGGFAWQVIELK